LNAAVGEVDNDIAQLAKGGRTNILGFGLRLIARIPFLMIGGRIYGAAALGRMAYAVLIIEFCAQLATNGMRRGLALQFAQGDRRHVNETLNALLVSAIISLPLIVLLRTFPHIMFPNSVVDGWDLLLPFVIIPFAWTEIMLAALAFKFDVATTVRVRSVVEPWTISIAAFILLFVSREDGLVGAYAASILASFGVAAYAFIKDYGVPRGWRFEPRWLLTLAWQNAPLSVADAIEWGTRRIDLAILGLFLKPEIVGVYYVAQQVASLPQKLKSSFEPVLGPVIARKLQIGDKIGVAHQLSQVGFWIIAAQLGIALTFILTAGGVMGLVGPHSAFVPGTKALIAMMVAEIVASPAVVSEAALVYIARRENMVISAAMIALQAMATYLALSLAPDWGVSLRWQAAIPAIVLSFTLLLASLIKARLARQLLGASVSVLRWQMLWAAGAAVIVGLIFLQLPEWADLAFGIPAIAGAYSVVLWRFVFVTDDRALFRRARFDPEMAHQH
jgi:O-antigen/teichoic acid export membrane protein